MQEINHTPTRMPRVMITSEHRFASAQPLIGLSHARTSEGRSTQRRRWLEHDRHNYSRASSALLLLARHLASGRSQEGPDAAEPVPLHDNARRSSDSGSTCRTPRCVFPSAPANRSWRSKPDGIHCRNVSTAQAGRRLTPSIVRWMQACDELKQRAPPIPHLLARRRLPSRGLPAGGACPRALSSWPQRPAPPRSPAFLPPKPGLRPRAGSGSRAAY